MADVVAGRLEGLGTPEVTAREVAERRGRSATELADECGEVRKAAVSHIRYLLARQGWHGEAPAQPDAAMEWILVATGRGAGGAESPPNIYA
jgi:hypothetical protein